eukprot:TRINITY_DN104175_c0_g1_i1.p1 TRINITY_DN104175_c0_g1~~TRINITY_DN104175_c0_g1_i1.p1  ORF type:complete len:254 (-),score=31.14 TRINITY_DN104175_c0_g1_i1:219-980(-)
MEPASMSILRYTGVVKSFNDQRGWGIVAVNETGRDVMVHIRDCKPQDVALLTGGQPAVGDVLSFELETRDGNPNQMQAKKVEGGTQERACNMKGRGKGRPVQGTGQYFGIVRAFNGFRGIGWIQCTDGTDAYVELKDCVGTRPVTGDSVQFDVEPSMAKPGKMQAINVTGGSAPLSMEDCGKGSGPSPFVSTERFVRNANGHLAGCVCATCTASGANAVVSGGAGCCGAGKGVAQAARLGPYNGGVGTMGRLY